MATNKGSNRTPSSSNFEEKKRFGNKAENPSANQEDKDKSSNIITGKLEDLVKDIKLNVDRTTVIYSALTGIDVNKGKNYDSLKGDAKKIGKNLNYIFSNMPYEVNYFKKIVARQKGILPVTIKNGSDEWYQQLDGLFFTISEAITHLENFFLVNGQIANKKFDKIYKEFLETISGEHGANFPTITNLGALMNDVFGDGHSTNTKTVKLGAKLNKIVKFLDPNTVNKDKKKLKYKDYLKDIIDKIGDLQNSNRDKLKDIEQVLKTKTIQAQTRGKSSVRPEIQNNSIASKIKPEVKSNSKSVNEIIHNFAAMTEIIAYISQMDINRKTLKKIKKLENLLDPKKGHFKELFENVANLSKEAKKEQTTSLQGITNYLQSVTQLGGFDDKAFKQLKKNIRDLDHMFMDPGILTELRLSDKGLLTKLIRDIDDRCADIKTNNKDTREIKIFLDGILSLAKSVDADDIKSLSDKYDLIDEVLDDGGPLVSIITHLNKIVKKKSFKNLIGNGDNDKNSGLYKISSLIEGLSDISRQINSKDAKNFNKGMLYMALAGKLINFQAKQWKKVDVKKIEEQKAKIEVIKSVIKVYNEIFKGSKYGTVLDNVKDLMKLSLWSMALARFTIVHTKIWSKIDGDDFISAGAKIKTFKDIIDAYANTFKSHKSKTVKNNVKQLIEIELLSSFLGVFTLENTLVWKLVKENNIVDVATKTESVIDSINSCAEKINEDAIETVKNALIGIVEVEFASIIAGVLALPATLALKFLASDKRSFIDALNKFTEKTNTIEAIDDDVSKKIDDIKDTLISLDKLSLYSIVGMVLAIPAMLGFAVMALEIKALAKFVKVLNDAKDIDTDKLKDIKDKIAAIKGVIEDINIISIMGALALPLALPGMIGFVMMAAEMWALSKIFKIFKNIEVGDDIKKNIEEAKKLVKSSAEILVIGAVVGTIATIAFPAIIMFEMVLALFIMSTIGAYNLASKGIEDSMQYAKDFVLLLAVSSGVLLVGSMLFAAFPQLIPNAILFGAILTGFVWAVTKVYVKNAQDIEDSIDITKEFTLLVAVSGAVLMLGSLFITDEKRALGALAFAILLSGFVFAITWTYKKSAKEMSHHMRAAKELIELIGISAAILLIGGAFMMIKDMPMAVLKFAAILGGFVAAITLVFGFAAKRFNARTKAAMIGLMGLIGVSGGVLLAAGYLITSGKVDINDIYDFLKADAVMIGGMAAMVFILGKFFSKQTLIQGELALAGIVGIILLLGKADQEIAKVALMINGKEKAFKNVIDFSIDLLEDVFIGVGVLAAVIGIGALFGGAVGAGAVGAVIAGAELLLAGAVKIIDLLGQAMQSIAQSMITFKKVGKIDFKPIYANIEGYLGILSQLKWLMIGSAIPIIGIGLMIGLNNAISAITKMSIMMSLMGKSVHDMSALTIPIYDGTKIVGYRNLDDDDFTNAAKNTKKIITVIGGAIIDTYNQNKEMFSAGFVGDLLGTKTPFEIVIRSCTTMGNMIAKIAEGVKDMAELKVPIYKGKEVVGYRSLDNKDFDNAANNVKKIITVLGRAIIDLYNSDGELSRQMFKDTTWYASIIGGSASNTPFAMVVKSSSKLGEMISKISQGVKDMANLRVNIYDKNGKVTGSREMTPVDFAMAALNTDLILSCLGNAIIDTYHKHPEIYTDTSLFHTKPSATPMGMVIGSMEGIGKLMSSVVKGISDVANLEIPLYDENGKLLGKRHLDKKLLSPNGQVYENIKALLMCLPNAILPFVEDNEKNDNPFKKLFGADTSFKSVFAGHSKEDLPIYQIAGAIQECTTMLDKVSASIKKVVDIKGIDYDKIVDQVNKLVTSIPEAIQNAAFKNGTDLKEMFNDADKIETIKLAFDTYTNIISTITNVYSKAGEAFKKLGQKPEEEMHKVGKFIWYGVRQLQQTFASATYFQNAKLGGINEDMVTQMDNLKSIFDKYKDSINEIFEIYTEAGKLSKNLASIIIERKTKDDESTNVIDTISNEINRMITGTMTNLRSVDARIMTMTTRSFQSSMEAYNKGMKVLFDVYNSAPEDMRKYDNVIKAIKRVNFQIESVGNTDNFKAETYEMSMFTHSINSINTQKAHTMQDLITAIEQMAVRLGGLDKLTDALANKLAVVLDKLVRELKESAKTINKADEMQKKRQDAIKKSITTINQLMAKPINVEVKQLPMDNQNTGGGPLPSPEGQKPGTDAAPSGTGNDGYSNINPDQKPDSTKKDKSGTKTGHGRKRTQKDKLTKR